MCKSIIFIIFIIFSPIYGKKSCVILDRERMRYPIYKDNLIEMAENREIAFLRDIQNFYYFVIGYRYEGKRSGHYLVKMTEDGKVIFIKDAEEKFYYFILGSVREKDEIFFLDKRSSEFVQGCNKIYIVNSDEMERLSKKYPNNIRRKYVSGEIYALEIPFLENIVPKNVTNIYSI